MYGPNPRFDTQNRTYNPFDLSNTNNIPMLRVNCPPNLQQYFPYIAQQVLDAVLYPAQVNPARIYLYNQIGYNNFENQDYAELLEFTAVLADKFLSVNRADPLQVISAFAKKVATFKCCDNFTKDQALAQSTPQQYLAGVQSELNAFSQFVRQIDEQVYAAQRQNNTQGLLYAGSEPANNGWGNAPRRGPGWGDSGGTGVAVEPGLFTTGGSWGGTGSAGGTNSATSKRGWANASSTEVTQPVRQSSAAGWTVGVTEPAPVRPREMQIEVMVVDQKSTLATNIIDAPQILSYSAMQAQPAGMPPVLPTPQAPAVPAVAADLLRQPFSKQQEPVAPKPDEPIAVPEWETPSIVDTVYAFDPNQVEVSFSKNSAGIVSAKYTPKEDMDIEQHLADPKIVDIKMETVAGAESDYMIQDLRQPAIIAEETTKDSKIKIEIVHRKKTISTIMVSSDAELIKSVETERQMREVAHEENPESAAHRRPSVVRMAYVHNTQAVKDLDLLNIVDAVAATNLSKEAVTILNEQKALAEKEGSKSTLAFIKWLDARITKRFNDFIYKELSLTSGSFTSFMEDIQDNEGYIGTKYGIGTMNVYLNNYSRLIKEALYYFKGEFRDDAIDSLVSENDRAVLERFHLTLVPFAEAKIILSVSATCKELRFDIPTTRCSVLLREDETPDFYRVVCDLMNVVDEIERVDGQRMRVIIMTSDGRSMEITTGALNTGTAYMLSVIG